MISTNAISVITDGSMAGSLTSSKVEMKNALMACVQVSWAGSSPSGTIKLQESIDDVHYNDIPGSTQTVSGNSGTGFYRLAQTPAPFLKIVYTRVSGTGTLQASIAYKGDPAL